MRRKGKYFFFSAEYSSSSVTLNLERSSSYLTLNKIFIVGQAGAQALKELSCTDKSGDVTGHTFYNRG